MILHHACINKAKRKILKTEINKYLNDIHQLKKEIERNKLQEDIADIESSSDDSRRMYKALRYIQTRGKKRTNSGPK